MKPKEPITAKTGYDIEPLLCQGFALVVHSTWVKGIEYVGNQLCWLNNGEIFVLNFSRIIAGDPPYQGSWLRYRQRELVAGADVTVQAMYSTPQIAIQEIKAAYAAQPKRNAEITFFIAPYEPRKLVTA